MNYPQTQPLGNPSQQSSSNMEPVRYCMECGAALPAGMQYCTECGTKVGNVANYSQDSSQGVPQALAVHHPENPVIPVAVPPQSYPPPYPVQNQSSGSGGVVIMGIMLIVAAIILLVCVLLFTKGDSENTSAPAVIETNTESVNASEEEEEKATEEDEDGAVELTKSCITDSRTPRPYAYPVFEFRYPENWTVVDGEISEEFDVLYIRDRSEEMYYALASDAMGQPYTVRIGNIEKVADCKLKFGNTAGTSSANTQKFAVVKFSIRSSDSPLLNTGNSVVAVLPEKAIDDPASIDFSIGIPSFKHGYNIAFLMIYNPDTIMDQILEEAIEILASIEFVRDVPASHMDSSDWSSYSYDGSAFEYVIPDSDKRVLTEDDLRYFTEYDLYLARNEIYARHGVIFASDLLNDYFGTTSWYRPSISINDFNDDVLNHVEVANLQTIITLERRMGSNFI